MKARKQTQGYCKRPESLNPGGSAEYMQEESADVVRVKGLRFIESEAVVRQVFLRCRDLLGRVGEREVSCPGDTDGGNKGLYDCVS